MSTFFQRLQAMTFSPAAPTGVYRCAHCNQLLFTTHTCFAQGHDWASFWAPVSDQNIHTRQNEIEGLERCEIACSNCHAHLGYKFDDGPQPTGRRLSITLKAVRFHPNHDHWAK
jgi:peptide-methionine (R)-S-oxide reductase